MRERKKIISPSSKGHVRWMVHMGLCYFLLFFAFKSFGQEQEVDHLSLAKVLVKDGYYERAERTLNKINPEEIDGEEAVLSSLWGMIQLHKQNYELALQNFDESLQKGLTSKEVYLYRAEALLQLGHLDQAQNSLEKIDAEQKTKLPYFLIQAEIAWKRGEKEKAFQVLSRAQAKNLSRRVITKKKFAYLIEEQLYLSASDLAFALLPDAEAFQDVLAMASQFRIAKQEQKALSILQSLIVLRPEQEMVALEMAQNYLALGENFSAALILEEAAKHNSSLSFEASEMLRQVGKSYRARFLNMSTTDPTKRLKQKLALHLEEDDYLSLKFMIPQLQANQLLEDQEIRYAVAYSLFRTGDFEKSESFLNSIDQDGLFEKSIELKREISHCKQEKWACSETI